MRSVNSTVDTINAAASAIVSADSRVHPPSVQKRRWVGCLSLYWCFGSHKSSKQIGHAVLVPEPEATGVTASSSQIQTNSTTVVLPFIAPPSSPASFLQSDPPSVTQSPSALLSLTSISLNACSYGGPASIFAIGPYAHETQLVTPPVFSAFTTEPSTAPFTPPPESVQLTTPSSPEVPFAQLLTSSLECARRNSGAKKNFALSQYEFQSYQQYPGSPGGQLISPGSVISNSGTASPFPDRHPIYEFCMVEGPKLLSFEHFSSHKLGLMLGSGSVTPDGVGVRSRLGSGSVTPDGMGLGSRLGSGSVTPDGVGLVSRLGSGSLTPDCIDAASRDGFLLENRIYEVVSLANSGNGSKTNDIVVDHRVSFELRGEELAQCLENKSAGSNRSFLEFPENIMGKDRQTSDRMLTDNEHCSLPWGASNGSLGKSTEEMEEMNSNRKHRSITLGSIKEFNFVNSKREVAEKPTISSEWWASETIAGKEGRHASNWTFFPLVRPKVS